MKKLMVMLMGAACATGAFADLPSGTSFSDWGAPFTAPDGDEQALWTNPEGAATVVDTETWVGNYDDTKGLPEQFPTATGDQTLKLTNTNEVTRKIAAEAVEISDGLYYDSLVKLTVFDYGDDPTLDAGVKLGVYLQKTSEDDETAETHLMVAAGYMEGIALSTQAYDCGTIETYATDWVDGRWVRLTVKAIDGITDGTLPGFVVFVNQNPVKCVTPKGDATFLASLVAQAQAWNNVNELFPSAANDNTIASVSFKGQGNTDLISFTDVAPEFAADKNTYMVSWDAVKEKITSITIDGETLTGDALAAGSKLFVAEGAYPKINISWIGKDNFCNGGKQNQQTGEDTPVVVSATDVKAAVATFAGEKYEALDGDDGAVAAANKPTAAGTLKLIEATVDDDIALNNALVTLDLNGQIVGDVGVLNGADITLANTGDGDAIIEGSVLPNKIVTNVKTIKFNYEMNYNEDTGLPYFTADFGSNKWVLAMNGAYYEIIDKPDFGGGDGSEATPYIISTADHLVELQEKVAAGDNFEGKYFKQTANIALTAAWAGIGSKDQPFAGIYDGDNNEITGLKFDAEAGTYAGLFRWVMGSADVKAVVKNLKVSMAADADNGFTNKDKAKDGEYGGAAVIGQAQYADLINLTAEAGTIEGTHNIAGIATKVIRPVKIENCVNKMSIIGKYTKMAGILCFTQDGAGDDMVEIVGCTNLGSVTGGNWVRNDTTTTPNEVKFSGQDGIGGIIAYVGVTDRVTIKDCSSMGTLGTTLTDADYATIDAALVNDIKAYTNNRPLIASFIGYGAGKTVANLGGNTTTLVDIPTVADYKRLLPTKSPTFAFATIDGEPEVATIVADNATLLKDGTAEYKVMASNKVDVVLAVGESILFDEELFPAVVKADDAEKNEVTKTLTAGSTYLYTCAAKSVGPQPVNPDDGNVDPDPTDPTGKTFIVTPAEGKTSVTLKDADSSMTIKVTSAADFTISGLNGAAVKVVAGGQDVTAYVKAGDPFNTALDDAKVKAVVDNREGVDTPFVIGETSDVTVKAIPGLTYTLTVAGAVDGDYGTAKGDDAVKTAGADDVTITLKDDEPPAGAGFYKINISK